jgi:RNA polymerase sigma-70 factor (ECF subfamily)
MTDWSHIVTLHGPMVWRTVYRLVRHDADAADCFQRAFVSALELSRSDVILNWAAFLKRVATARAIECLRQRRRAAERLTTLPDHGSADSRAVQPIELAEASELGEHLRAALAELDDLPAQVFCLACLEGFSYQEIAEHLGVTVNHVGVLLNRARASLRQRLRAYGPAPAAENFGKEIKP